MYAFATKHNCIILNIIFLLLLINYRSDEEDPSGNKYNRMDEENIQDKERFAR